MGDAYADIPKYGGNYAKAIAACINSRQCEAEGKQLMCPSYRVSGDERLSTGGRVRLLKAALSTSQAENPLLNPELAEAMELCVSCKGCKRECEANVDMPLIKAEYLAQKYQQQPRPLRSKLFAQWADLLDQYRWLGGLIRLYNHTPLLKPLAARVLKLNPQANLPEPSFERLSQRQPDIKLLPGKRVALFVDSFTRRFEPHIAEAAAELLERAGYQVEWLQPANETSTAKPLCCGRTLLAQGMILEAKASAGRLVTSICEYVERGYTIVGLEASCVLGLRDDAKALGLGDSVELAAQHTLLLEEFLARELKSGRLDLPFLETDQKTLVHGHCHQKAVGAMKSVRRIMKLLPKHDFEFIESSCCGMAGTFGLEAEHADLSSQMANQSLLPAISQQPGCTVVANGFSCRQQIRQHSQAEPIHLAELLARQLPPKVAVEAESTQTNSVPA
nr:(Fe-S)-binding protein [Oceanobacter mangrovi]